ncbi:MAG TPA: twin-arginine translocation signal domain-containing protein [Verrucomicrobiae bacterium]|nr:twin-arginine translocation signal domain-containing protein [Verrucomicrobiae bacterium]
MRSAPIDRTSRRKFLTRTAAAGIAAAILRPASQAAAVNGLPDHAGLAQTVLGPLDASKLGFTLPHEHIADGPHFYLPKWPKAWGGRAEFVAKAVDRLKVVRDAGVSTIVDLTTYDVGRDIRFLEEVSRKSGLHMIACTGQRFFPPTVSDVSMPSRTIEGLAEFFIKEIEQGIDGTRIKAGVIKIWIITQNVTALEEIGLRAAARASKATGVPIRTHTDAAHRAGESHAVILQDEGINPARVSFDHSDGSGDMGYFLGLVRRGYSLGMDHVHRGISPNSKPSFERRAECIKLLVDAGFAEKVFLSQDSEFGGSLFPEDMKEWRDRLDPPDGMLFATRELIPYLKRMGVSDHNVHTMTVENPRSFFRLS